MSKMLKIKLVHSTSGRDKKQKLVVKGLGFRKLNEIKEVKDTPELRGMVNKVPHLVKYVTE